MVKKKQAYSGELNNLEQAKKFKSSDSECDYSVSKFTSDNTKLTIHLPRKSDKISKSEYDRQRYLNNKSDRLKKAKAKYEAMLKKLKDATKPGENSIKQDQNNLALTNKTLNTQTQDNNDIINDEKDRKSVINAKQNIINIETKRKLISTDTIFNKDQIKKSKISSTNCESIHSILTLDSQKVQNNTQCEKEYDKQRYLKNRDKRVEQKKAKYDLMITTINKSNTKTASSTDDSHSDELINSKICNSDSWKASLLDSPSVSKDNNSFTEKSHE